MSRPDQRPGPPAPGSARPARPAPRLDLVGEDVEGREVVRRTVGHGDDPELMLAQAGWRVERGLDVTSDTSQGHVLTARLRVSRGEPVATAEPHVSREEGLQIGEDERLTVFQRIAAYAVVTSRRGVLMTQYSDRTGAPGAWGLPGGGIEPGESPGVAVGREVWEESGQRVRIDRFVGLRSRHWIGRAPNGRLEDYHVVRVVFTATCERPTDPVVHDVGGTTASACWVAAPDLARLRVTAGWREMLDAELGRAADPGAARGG